VCCMACPSHPWFNCFNNIFGIKVNVMLSLYFIKHRAMKTYGGVEI
jgi:hypothetical protein